MAGSHFLSSKTSFTALSLSSNQPWSFTGHKTHLEGRNVPQPDNAEFDINESVEACMGILNDIYEAR